MPNTDDTDQPGYHRLFEAQEPTLAELVLPPVEPPPEINNPVAPNQTPTPPEPNPVLLTRQQCLDHIDQLKLKLCYILDGGAYWKSPPGSGVTRVKAEAARISVMTASSLMGNASHIELVDQDTAKKIAALKFSARAVIGKQTEDLLKLAPLNPTARAHVLAACGQMPPADADTWEKVRDWVEMNYTPPAKPTVQRDAYIAMRFRQEERGTCTYVAENRVSSQYDLGPQIESEMATNPNRSLDQIISTLITNARTNAQQDLNPDMYYANTEDYSYDDYNSTSHGPIRTEIVASPFRVREVVIDYLMHTQSADVLRRYGLRPFDPQSPF